MASLLLSLSKPAMLSSSPALGEALSGVFGSISMTAWICLLLPQLITNYKAQSADGLSMAFLFVWLAGDITNLSGAFFTSLAPTAIAIGCYFCVADVVLICQCTYYNTLNARRRRRQQLHAEPHKRPLSASDDGASELNGAQTAVADDSGATESSPLLSTRRRNSSISARQPMSHRRRHSNRPAEDALTRIVTGEHERRGRIQWLFNALSVAAVYLVGAAGWFVSWRMGAWEADPNVPDTDDTVPPQQVVGMILGYTSAVCYLCARVPQIVKNYRNKSCEGLSLLFFLLSLTGNFTYGASLLAYSQDGDYVLRALPWLLGSLGTIVEDCIIFVQFRLYTATSPKADLTVA